MASAAEFVVDAAARRKRDVGAGVFGLLAAGVVAMIAVASVQSLCERAGQFDIGTVVYRRAQWASTAAQAALTAGLWAMVVWLVGRSAAAALGVPVPRGSSRQALTKAALGLAVAALILVLLVWSSDETVVRWQESAPEKSLMIGLLLCALFAFDIPRLAANGRAALGGRLWMRAITPPDLASLRGAQRVRLRGVVASAGTTLLTLDGPAVCIHRFASRDARWPAIEAVPFYLECDGGRVLVDPTPPPRLPGDPVDRVHLIAEILERPVVVRRALAHEDEKAGGHGIAGAEIDPATERVLGALRVGERIEVVGTLSGGSSVDAYRGGERRITSGAAAAQGERERSPRAEAERSAPLYLLSDGSHLGARLAIAAAVEIACAAGLAVCALGFVVVWTALRSLARTQAR